MPKSLRNSSGLSMRARSRFIRCPRTSASSLNSPIPGSCQRETSPARSGRWTRNQSIRRAHLEPLVPIIRQVQHVVEELVLFVPQGDAHSPQIVERAGNVQEVLEEL